MATVTWNGDRQPAHPAHLGADVVVDVLPQHRVVFLVDADRVGDGVRLTLAVVQHRIQIADLAETVAAELQRRGHEAKAPLADVERGAPVVVLGRVAVGHDHLGKRDPVCHRAFPLAVAIADRVQCHPLAVVEPDPQRPVLPLQQVAVEGERHPFRLVDVQRLEWLAPRRGADALGDVLGHVLAHHRGGFDAAPERPLSSIRNNSIELTSMTQCRPLTGWAYGFCRGRPCARCPTSRCGGRGTPAAPPRRRRSRCPRTPDPYR